MRYRMGDLEWIGSREFRSEATGEKVKTRNGKWKNVTRGVEYCRTKAGRFTLEIWYQLMEEAVAAEYGKELLEKVMAHVKENCYWLHGEKEIREYSLECISNKAYEAWKGFAYRPVRKVLWCFDFEKMEVYAA